MVGSVLARVVDRLPSSFAHRCEQEEAVTTYESETLPCTLKAAVRILPETKLLHTTENQDIWVGIEIAGVLHNRNVRVDASIDVVFVIDNRCVSHSFHCR